MDKLSIKQILLEIVTKKSIIYTWLLAQLKNVYQLDNSMHGRQVKEIVNLQKKLVYKTMNRGHLQGSSMSHR